LADKEAQFAEEKKRLEDSVQKLEHELRDAHQKNDVSVHLFTPVIFVLQF
jgi:hypothetical protein